LQTGYSGKNTPEMTPFRAFTDISIRQFVLAAAVARLKPARIHGAGGCGRSRCFFMTGARDLVRPPKPIGWAMPNPIRLTLREKDNPFKGRAKRKH
jgi:hypothetical protein